MTRGCPLCDEDHTGPCPDEFMRFIAQLRKSAPEGYKPWLFRCGQKGKDPATEFGSWKDEDNRLSPKKAAEWIEHGYNIGIGGMGHDRLANVDIDDDDETDPDDMKDTLRARSRSRYGRHGFYFEADGEEIPNIPTDDKGEVRAQGQYVLAPGSFVPTDAEEVPEGQEEKAGYYTVEKAREPATITQDELPEVFQRKIHQQQVEAGDDENARNDEPDVPKGDGKSAVFKVTAEDVAHREGASTDPSDRWGSAFHGSTTGENMSLSNEGRIQCWRHNVAHGGLQALAALSDYPKGCADIGTGHKDSNSGPSCIKGDDSAIWHAWKFAKENGYIPNDDPVPYRALKHICRERDLCPVTEIPDGYDPDEGKTIPEHAYDAAISTIREHDGFDPGREKVSESHDQSERASTDGGATTATGGDSPNASDGTENNDGNGWAYVRSQYSAALDKDSPVEKNDARFEAAEQLLDEFHFANREDDDVLFVYGDESGIYEGNGESVIRQRARDGLQGAFARQEVGELAEHVRAAQTYTVEEFGGPDWHINVQNGVLKINLDGDAELLDHSPEFRFINQAGAEYDPDADCPRWRQYLQETVKSETHRMKLQEYAGYCLMHWGLPEHKALFLVGPQASGKSTFADTIRALLGGAENVASMSPQQMTDRFGTAELFGAWANIRNDIPPDTIQETGAFKEITAGDPIKAERKGKPLFHFRPNAKHIFSANQLPDAEEDDGAFYRRVLLVPFPTTIPRDERDKSLSDKLKSELPGILNWALDGLSRLLAQDAFTGDMSVHKTAETWDKWGSTVDRFAKVCLETSTDATPKAKTEVYRIYQRFCDDENFPAQTQRQLTRRLKTEHSIQDGKATVDGRQQRCYLNLEYTARAEQYQESDRDGGDGSGLDDYS